jgi:hypothetical protein
MIFQKPATCFVGVDVGRGIVDNEIPALSRCPFSNGSFRGPTDIGAPVFVLPYNGG